MKRIDFLQDQATHNGEHYTIVMQKISKARRTRRYLEIGVNTGNLLSNIYADIAVGVDPEFVIDQNICRNKGMVQLFQKTSDEFFHQESQKGFGEPFDLAFLDGFHTFEFLLRDFYNTESRCTTESLIVMHDCLPLTPEMADRDYARAFQRGVGTRYPDHWTGDVWKIIPILLKFRSDLKLIFLDAPPTGLLCVTNLDPSSKSLRDRYTEIVDEFRGIGNGINDIAAMYDSIEIESTFSVTRADDHSLYFKI